ncbi:hypothetical protein VII00023_05672 [Vibrio ichthyoenteri ATCC 700023]|uniref:SURF1-like protein n=1 Tax=Vibrio ichthyoenteri ATCC 700023 TaxID=870968 RepID=F9S6C8_9VIBR|nr:SURF1 family protein [Vibrio ichthyoenteri]EGU33754.1 hypothetical protein VII00023_05672 [Vibrio ichthyoenteri ATCC 700023]
MKTITLSLVQLMKQPPFWLALILTVVAISVLVNLGLWQLNRAEQKRVIQEELAQNQHQAARQISEIAQAGTTNITGQRVMVSAWPVSGQYLLLDNQIFEGQVGYLAIQLMKTELGRYLLLERGFVPAPANRSTLPQVEWLTQRYVGEGRLYLRSNNPLSDALMAEDIHPTRIQNLNIEELRERWQLPIENFVVQPLVKTGSWGYPQPWNPLPMSAGKHIGYAVQWFGMAIALAILALIWLFVAIKTARKR